MSAATEATGIVTSVATAPIKIGRMHNGWALLLGVFIFTLILEGQTKGKISGFLMGLPVVGPFFAKAFGRS